MTKGKPSWAHQIGDILGELFQRLEAPPGIFYNHLCERVRQLFEADFVWFGVVDGHGEVHSRAFSGKEAGYLRGLRINIYDPSLSQGPTGQALLKKKPVAEKDVLRSKRFTPWRQRALAFGFRSSASLPLIFQNEVCGTLNLYSVRPGHFSSRSLAQLVPYLQVLGYAVKTFEVLQKKQENLEKSRREIQRLERRLYFQESRIRYLEEFHRRWLAILAHELRTPLTTIAGFSEFLLEGLPGPLNPKQREKLLHIHKASQQLLEVIEELRKAASYTGKKDLLDSPFSWKALLESLLSRFRSRIQEKGLQVSVRVPETLQGRGDPVRIKEALHQLLSNAVKFSPPGGHIFLQVRSFKEAQGRRWFSVEIKDEGPGIPPGLIPRVFEPFFQGKSLYTAKPQGLGLGLSLARDLIEAHGGVLLILPSSKGAHLATFLPENPLKKSPREVLLPESRPEVAFRLSFLLAAEGLRPTLLPGLTLLYRYLCQDPYKKILALDPWEQGPALLAFLKKISSWGLPVLFYRATPQGKLSLALGATFLSLSPLSFPAFKKLRQAYLEVFEVQPSTIFLAGRPHLLKEARRLVKALGIDPLEDPSRAEALGIDLGLPAQEWPALLPLLPPQKPLFAHLDQKELPPFTLDGAVPPEIFRREVSRILAFSEPEVGGAGPLA